MKHFVLAVLIGIVLLTAAVVGAATHTEATTTLAAGTSTAVTTASGSCYGLLIQNIGTDAVHCQRVSPAVATTGFLLVAGGGSVYFDDQEGANDAFYCISTNGSTVYTDRHCR